MHKMTFLESAKYVLKKTGKPLGSKDIAKLAIDMDLLNSAGETPWKTFNSKISADILNKSDESEFMRVSDGVYALREWKHIYSEYQAKRYIKKLYDEEIAVFSIENLASVMPKFGLHVMDEDFSDHFRKIIFPMKRSEAEQDFGVIQLISVFVITYENKILTHLRSKRLPESRLHGEYSVMLGGHLGIDDFMQIEMSLINNDDVNFAHGFLLRELSEELVLKTNPTIKRIGLLYDTSREVSKQHIGLVYSVELHEMKFEIGERGFLMNPKFETLKEIGERKNDFENWSLILLDNSMYLGFKDEN